MKKTNKQNKREEFGRKETENSERIRNHTRERKKIEKVFMWEKKNKESNGKNKRQ